MKCGELMTRAPVVCAADDDCATAASLLDDHDVGSLPVVQSREVPQVIGIVTDRDLCCRVLAPDARASATCVRDVMSPDVLCCTEDDDVEEALGVMEARQVRRVPIVDDAGECVGIVTTADVARDRRLQHRLAELLHALSAEAASRPRARRAA